MVRYSPGVDFFLPFHDLNPSKQNRCIFYTQKQQRCKCFCRENDKAIEIHQRISGCMPEEVSLDEVVEYILCICCGERKGARHRNTIENIGLLLPLAERWFNEIQTRPRSHTTPPRGTTYSTPSTPLSKVRYESQTSSVHSFSNSSSNAGLVETALTSPYDSRLCSPWSSPKPIPSIYKESPTHFCNQSLGNHAHYNLRSKAVTSPAIKNSKLAVQYDLATLSEFQPHVQEPSQYDSVTWKLRESLKRRDFETGSVYIFKRASSPGYVKIGWTARSRVQVRLDEWSKKCGYTPILVFSAGKLPWAQRAETLTHYELIKEWRRERRCKRCETSHMEWFEVSEERAIQVLGRWTRFFKMAEPYEDNGSIKAEWRDVIDRLSDGEEVITSQMLLEEYEARINKPLVNTQVISAIDDKRMILAVLHEREKVVQKDFRSPADTERAVVALAQSRILSSDTPATSVCTNSGGEEVGRTFGTSFFSAKKMTSWRSGPVLAETHLTNEETPQHKHLNTTVIQVEDSNKREAVFEAPHASKGVPSAEAGTPAATEGLRNSTRTSHPAAKTPFETYTDPGPQSQQNVDVSSRVTSQLLPGTDVAFDDVAAPKSKAICEDTPSKPSTTVTTCNEGILRQRTPPPPRPAVEEPKALTEQRSE